MKIADFPIKHPIIIIVLSAALLFFGIASLAQISTDLFPDIGLPTIAVYTIYKGVGPKDVEEDITIPLENIVSGLAGVKQIESRSSEGVSVIVVSYVWGKDLAEAQVELREAINQVSDSLPDDAEIPMMIKYSPSNIPVCTLSVSGVLGPNEIMQLLDDEILARLQRIDGVARIDIYGGDTRIVDIALDLTLLESRGIAITDIVQQFRYENVNFPAGNIIIDQKDHVIRTVGEFEKLEDIRNMAIGFKDNAFIYLKDVATVEFGHAGLRAYSFDARGPCVFLEFYKQSGKNTVQVLEQLKKEFTAIEADYGNKIAFTYISDQSEQITNSLNSVATTAIYGGLLAIVILFLFLGNIRTTLIIGFSIPFSVISTFFLMRSFGLTFNLMTLGGLSLGVGMLVDNAIVVLENIFRNFNNGMEKREAAAYGANEVGGAILASTLTTLAVFGPLITVEGIPGIIFRDLAKTIAFALAMSLISALTIIPLLTSRFLKHDAMLNETRKKFILFRLLENFFEMLEKGYGRIIRFALDHRLLVIAFALILLVIALPVVFVLGFSFLPNMDQGEINISLEMKMGTPLEKTREEVAKLANIIEEKVPEAESYLCIYGFGGSEAYGGVGRGTNYGSITVKLTPREKRKRDIWEIIEFLRNEVESGMPGVKAYMRLGGLGSYVTVAVGGGADISIAVKGSNFDSMYDTAEYIKSTLENIEGARDVRLDIVRGLPEVQINVKKKEANTLGLTTFQVALAARAAMSGIDVSRFRGAENEAPIRLRLNERDRKNIDNLQRIFVKNPRGELIPLSIITDIRKGKSPSKIKRFNKQRIISVLASNENRNASEIINELMELIDKNRIPVSISVEPSGTEKEMGSAFNSLGIALLLAVFLVYVVMAIQFESFLHPFIVMFSIPFSFIGVIFGLLIGGSEFSVIAFLGIIMLAGIVVNNAIVLIDYINIQRRHHGQSVREAILTATKTRLRPIMMTTLTTILGLVPFSLALSSGSEMYRPLGQAVIGGLLTSTMITLVLIPVIYYTFEQWKKRLGSRQNDAGKRVSTGE
jgi:HAE1 family hydrophobic/amphiphilic exporter-1